MLHIVNEAKDDFTLKIANSHTVLVLVNKKNNEEYPICELNDRTLAQAKQKLEETGGTLDILHKRTTKFSLNVPNQTLLYSVNAFEDYAPMSAMYIPRNTGKKSDYNFPKSAIIIITESTKTDKGGQVFVTPQLSDGDDTVEGTPIKNFKPVNRVVTTIGESDRCSVSVFTVNYAKWNNIKTQTYIILPSEDRLLLGVVETNGREINALIRCDKDGNIIERKKNNRRNDKYKKSKKGAR